MAFAKIKALIRKAAARTEMGAVLEDKEKDIPGRLCWLLATISELPTADIDLPDAMVAMSLALEIENTYQREAALENVVKCLSGNGRFRDAVKTAFLIEDEDDRYDQFGDIAGAMTKSGDLSGALRVVNRIPEGNLRKSFAYNDLVRVLIDKGLLENADSIIRISEFTRPKGALRAKLAVAFLKEGNEGKATENARKSLEAYNMEDAGSFSAWLILEYLHPVSNLLRNQTQSHATAHQTSGRVHQTLTNEHKKSKVVTPADRSKPAGVCLRADLSAPRSPPATASTPLRSQSPVL